MRKVTVALPTKVEEVVEQYIQNGWFTSKEDLLRTALIEFIRHNKFLLSEGFMKEDIQWALKAKVSHPNL